jgi:succinate dehydrogenase / fumarate reductase cytochrome b subunit
MSPLQRPAVLRLVPRPAPPAAAAQRVLAGGLGPRLPGILLAACVPLAVYLLDLSLRDEQGFARLSLWFQPLAVKALAVLLVWAFAQHLLMGVRHLLRDLRHTRVLATSTRADWPVRLCGVGVALLAAGIWL